ncbi:MAG: PorP/SprF family type IX secretion system membrane protein [Sphingobacteriaceae bacterium]|nr:PorP/SprF family type IX secretion system membrane protein [Sphingobacteriaceae bacterium]
MKSVFRYVITLLIGTFLMNQAEAQINPITAQYFQNPYLANPAMAGVQQGLQVNVGYRRQWSNNVPGAPTNTSVTATHGFKKVGLGLNMYKDQAGLLDRTKMMATYAYHLPINNGDGAFSFGLSLGLQRDQLNTSAIVGQANDPIALGYNDREIIFDGDFGLAYTNNRLTIEGSVNNLKKQLKTEDQNTADFSIFYTAISYKLQNTNWQFIPKVAYRGVQNYQNMMDLGVEVKSFANQLALSTMYHTNQSFSFGLSYQNGHQWQFLACYSTPTTQIQAYSNGSFELGLQLNLNKRK